MNRASLGRPIGVAALLFAMFAAACGGKVFIDVPGGGGGGGNGGAPGGTLVGDCTILCNSLGDCGEGGAPQDCVGSCQDSAAAIGLQCQDEYLAYLDCLVANLSSIQNCNPPVDACSNEISDLSNCAGGTSSVGVGGASPGDG